MNITVIARRCRRTARATMPLIQCALLLAVSMAGAAETGEYVFPAAEDTLVGQPEQRVTAYEDTLAAIARQTGVGFAALKRANPQVDPWLPGAAATLVLPTAVLLPDGPREGILVNLAERRLYYFDRANARLLIYPVGIGRRDFPTPTVLTETVLRDNPMGDYAIKLAAPGLFIHGTNRPLGVGGRVSHGCLRLYPEHIQPLATQVPSGTPVRVIDEPYKVAWHGNALYLEAHPDESPKPSLNRMVRQIIEATREQPATVDWGLATSTARAAAGLPVQIGSRQTDD